MQTQADPTTPYDQALVGYVRVSTEEQNEDMQVRALIRAGVDPENIHVDKGVSGIAKRKPAREMALKQMRAGDTLVVWRLDRVSRSLLDLLLLLQDLDRTDRGFRSLSDAIDTKTPVGRVMLAILGAFAQFERDIIAERTRAGVKRAQERGVRFGKPSVMTDEVRATIARELAGGKSAGEAAEAAGIAESTLRKWYKSRDIARLRGKAEDGDE